MGRPPPSLCDDDNLKKGPWTSEEDDKLVQYIDKHGHGSWRALPKLAGLNRCGKSCRLRWTNYLRPDIKRGKFSPEEEQTILNLHSILGNKWSAIAGHLPGRTDNEIKNFWNTHLKKKLIQMGFDPMTHRPRTDIFSSLPHLLALANLGEMMYRPPWEDHSAQMAKLQCLQYLLQFQSTATSSSPMTSNLVNIEPVFLPPSLILDQRLANFQEQEQQRQMIPASIINENNVDGDQLLCTAVDVDNRENNTQTQQTQSLMNMASLPEEDRSLVVNLPPFNDTGDACSTISYDGYGTPNSLWNDLFLDDILPF